MTKTELYDLIRDYHDTHKRMWVEWAKNVYKEREDLDIFNVVGCNSKPEFYYKNNLIPTPYLCNSKPKFYYKNNLIPYGCFLCALAKMANESDNNECDFCTKAISFFDPNLDCDEGSIFYHFITAKEQHEELIAMQYALEIAESIRPVDEIFENMKHICTPEEWIPKFKSVHHFSGLNMNDNKRVFNRMWFYKAEFDPDFMPDWDNRSQRKYFPLFSYYSKEWVSYFCYKIDTRQGLPYFSKQACIELVEKLNSGEVEF
jgi:hypothetical protein